MILCAVSFLVGSLNTKELMDNCRALENCGATRSEVFNLLLAMDPSVTGKPPLLNDSGTQASSASLPIPAHPRRTMT